MNIEYDRRKIDGWRTQTNKSGGELSGLADVTEGSEVGLSEASFIVSHHHPVPAHLKRKPRTLWWVRGGGGGGGRGREGGFGGFKGGRGLSFRCKDECESG